MKHLFKSDIINPVIIGLTIILFIKLVWVAVSYIWLPTSGVEYSEEKGTKNLYYRVRLASESTGTKQVEKKQETKTVMPQASIKDIDLLAVYSASDFTVVTVKHKNKTKVLSTGEVINGFVLEGAGSDYATFSKDEKLYKVVLLKPKKSQKSTGSIKTIKPVKKSNTVSTPKKEKKVLGEIVDAGDHKVVDKSLISHYATNMDDIFKDIGIKDLKKGDTLQGFQVSFVRQGSHFSKLGLQKGDIIKSINGQEMKSYNAAFGMYKNIQNIENMTLVIERDNKEMELEYEVN